MDDRNRPSDRELLIRIDERMDTVAKRLNDHGERLRVLERIATVATVLGGAVVVVVGGARDSLAHWVREWISR